MAAAGWVRVALCAALVGCGGKAPELVPSRLAGQVPADYRLDQGRGVVLARMTVSTQGQPGFGAITNPLLVELREQGTVAPDETPQGLSLPHPSARVWTHGARHARRSGSTSRRA